MYIILAVVVVLLLSLVVTPYLKKKNILSDSNLKTIDQVLLFARIILSKNIKDEKDRIQMTVILDTIKNVLRYTNEHSKTDHPDTKIELAKSFIANELTNLGVQIDYENELLIDIILENAFNLKIYYADKKTKFHRKIIT